MRLNEFVNAFGEKGLHHGVCKGDFGPVMSWIGTELYFMSRSGG